MKEVVQGDTVTFEHSIEKNFELTRNLRFDFFIFPGQRHGYGAMSDYWFWRRAEYFVKHLIGDHRWSANITELDVEWDPPGGR